MTPPTCTASSPQVIVEGWNVHTLALGPNASGTTSAAPSAYKKPDGDTEAVPLSQGKPVTASSTEATGNVAATP